MCWPRSPRAPRPSSRPPTGRSSRPMTWTPTPASSWWRRYRPASMPSPVTTAPRPNPPSCQLSQPDPLAPPPGQQLVEAVQPRIDAFARHYGPRYPAAVRCLLADRAQLTTYLRFPTAHHPRIRHSNFIERTFGETRRRVKVIGRLPGEASCLSLVWAVLDRASRGWRGVTQPPTGVRLLQDLRRQLFSPSARKEVVDEAVAAAA